MIIAEQKRKENIAEYLLYMYQVEDMIRANQLDLDGVEQTLISKFEVSYELKREMREWYKTLITMMRDEKKEQAGHLSILENIMLGKRLSLPLWKCLGGKKTAQQEAVHYLEKVRLSAHASKYPHELSGGMQQRVAIAQALIMKPKILLMDEPFGALDPGTREAMQILILELWEAHGMTIFFVTHDLEEAVILGTRLIVLSQYYTHETTRKSEAIMGARIVSDYHLRERRVSSTRVKETAEFGKLIQKIRYEGFDPEYRQHATEFNLQHPDSFITLAQG